MDCGSSIILVDLPSQLALAQMVERAVVFALDAKVVIFVSSAASLSSYNSRLQHGHTFKICFSRMERNAQLSTHLI